MKKVFNMLLVIPFLLAAHMWAVGPSDVAKNAVSKDTMAKILSKASVAVRFCANGIKQGAVRVGDAVGRLTIASLNKMPVQVKEKLVYAWEKVTKTTTGKIASGTVGAVVLMTALYKLTHNIHYRAPRAATH